MREVTVPSSCYYCLGMYCIREVVLVIAPMHQNRKLSELKEDINGLNMREAEVVGTNSFKQLGSKATCQTISLRKAHLYIAYQEDGHPGFSCRSKLHCAIFPVTS